MQVHPLSSLKTRKLLDVSPRKLRCPFMAFEVVECPVTLTNGTDYYVSVWITATCQDIFSYIRLEGDKYFNVESWQDEYHYPWRLCMMEPHSTCLMTMVMKKQLMPRKDTCKFVVQMIVMPSKEHHKKLESDICMIVNLSSDHHVNTRLDLDRDIDIDTTLLYMDDGFDNVNSKVKELGGKVYRVMMAAVCAKVS